MVSGGGGDVKHAIHTNGVGPPIKCEIKPNQNANNIYFREIQTNLTNHFFMKPKCVNSYVKSIIYAIFGAVRKFLSNVVTATLQLQCGMKNEMTHERERAMQNIFDILPKLPNTLPFCQKFKFFLLFSELI